MLTPDKLNTIAATISRHRIGLVLHRPESWARIRLCYENVRQKVEADGGRPVYGWLFYSHSPAHLPNTGYIAASNHAVWGAPDGQVIDVTPHRIEGKPYPLTNDAGDVLFLMDETATPVRRGLAIGPRPSTYHALSDDPELLRYVEDLNRREREDLERILQTCAGGQPP